MRKFTPEYAEMVSGVDRRLIVEAARMYATAQNGSIFWGMGISQLSHGTASALGLIHLALLTGHIGRRGTGLNPLRGQNNVQGASDAGAMPFHYPGYMEVEREENARLWEAAWNVEPGGLSRKRGLTTTEILSQAHPGGVRSLYIMGENPVMTEPNMNVTRQHMQELEFLVAQDIFINESGAYADVILPAAAWAEKEGTFTNTDRRVQRVRKAIAPRGRYGRTRRSFATWRSESNGDWGDPTAPAGATRIPSRSIARWPVWPPPCSAGSTMPGSKRSACSTRCRTRHTRARRTCLPKAFPAGRGRFFPLEYVPVAEEPDEEFPFVLTTGRLLEHWHGGTMTRHSQLDALYPQAYVEMHEIDALRCSVATGDAVRVASRRGSIVLHVLVSPKATPGVVFIPMHFAEAAANVLTIDMLDPEAKIPEFKACAVNIQIAEAVEGLHLAPAEVRGRY